MPAVSGHYVNIAMEVVIMETPEQRQKQERDNLREFKENFDKQWLQKPKGV